MSSRAENRVVIHFGPKLRGRGGVASAIGQVLDSELSRRWKLVFVGSVTGGASRPVRLVESAWFPVKVIWALARWPRALVHVHMSRKGSYYRKRAAIALSRIARRRVVVQVHGSLDSWAREDERVGRAVARTLSEVDVVVALSESWRDRVLDIAPDAACVVIRNGVPLPRSRSNGSEPPCVVFLGLLGEHKGVPELVQAIASLQADGVVARWVIAGNGDVESTGLAVRQLPRPAAVDVPGWLGPDERETLLRAADVFVLPSHDEGLPMSLLEAMAHGLACVVTPVGGIPEVVDDGLDGLFVPPGNPDALASALHLVLGDRALRSRLGAAARTRVADCCSIETVAGEWDLLYESLNEVSESRNSVRGEAADR